MTSAAVGVLLLVLLLHLGAGHAVHDSDLARRPAKPKRYKCVLVEDDEPLMGLGGPSYLTELQQRRQLVSHKTSEDGPEINIIPPRSHPNPPRKPSTPVRQALPAAPAPPQSPPALSGRPLKQVTLNRARPQAAALPHPAPPSSATSGFSISAPSPASIPSPQGKQLVLSTEHCHMISHYANLYGVQDVTGWVHKNCGFAKMYLPNATCEEIDQLVASCYRQ